MLCILYTQPKTPQACQQVATKLVNFIKSVKTKLFATCHLQICYNLLKQLVASLWITSFDNERATSLLTTCNRLVVIKLSQAKRTYAGISLLITRPLQLPRSGHVLVLLMMIAQGHVFYDRTILKWKHKLHL